MVVVPSEPFKKPRTVNGSPGVHILRPFKRGKLEDGSFCNSRNTKIDDLSDDLFLNILSRLSPLHVAGSCSFVNYRWLELSSNDLLWRQFCDESLTEIDASRCLNGWKGLYERVFCSNLVACPFFETIHPHEADRRQIQLRSEPFEPRHQYMPNRIHDASATWDDDQPVGWTSTWRPDPVGRFHEGMVWEALPLDAQPCKIHALSSSSLAEGGECPGAVSTAAGWNSVFQQIRLTNFSSLFLDASPRLRVGAWYSGNEEEAGEFRLQLVFRDQAKGELLTWRSEEMAAPSNEWKHFQADIEMPKGTRQLVVRAAGLGHKRPGFYGARFTGISLHFLASPQILV